MILLSSTLVVFGCILFYFNKNSSKMDWIFFISKNLYILEKSYNVTIVKWNKRGIIWLERY
jgi:hypothetical protein